MQPIVSNPLQAQSTLFSGKAQTAQTATPIRFGADSQEAKDTTDLGREKNADKPTRTKAGVLKTLLSHYFPNGLIANTLFGSVVGAVIGLIFPPAIPLTMAATAATIVGLNLTTMAAIALLLDPNGQRIDNLYKALGVDENAQAEGAPDSDKEQAEKNGNGDQGPQNPDDGKKD